jgi:hypothetical protein
MGMARHIISSCLTDFSHFKKFKTAIKTRVKGKKVKKPAGQALQPV